MLILLHAAGVCAFGAGGSEFYSCYCHKVSDGQGVQHSDIHEVLADNGFLAILYV